MKQKSSTWHMDETFVRIAGKWMYLFRAVDSHGQTVEFYLSETRDREAAKLFLERALANPDNRTPQVFARDGLRSYPAAIRELQADGRVKRGAANEPDATAITVPSHQPPVAFDAGTAAGSNSMGGYPRDRGRPDDTKGPGARNHAWRDL